MSTNITWSVAIEEQFYIMVSPVLLGEASSLSPSIFCNHRSFWFVQIHSFERLDDALFSYTECHFDMAVGGLAAYLALNSRGFKDWFARCPRWLLLVVYFAGIILMLFRRDVFVGSNPGPWKVRHFTILCICCFRATLCK